MLDIKSLEFNELANIEVTIPQKPYVAALGKEGALNISLAKEPEILVHISQRKAAEKVFSFKLEIDLELNRGMLVITGYTDPVLKLDAETKLHFNSMSVMLKNKIIISTQILKAGKEKKTVSLDADSVSRYGISRNIMYGMCIDEPTIVDLRMYIAPFKLIDKDYLLPDKYVSKLHLYKASIPDTAVYDPWHDTYDGKIAMLDEINALGNHGNNMYMENVLQKLMDLDNDNNYIKYGDLKENHLKDIEVKVNPPTLDSAYDHAVCAWDDSVEACTIYSISLGISAVLGYLNSDVLSFKYSSSNDTLIIHYPVLEDKELALLNYNLMRVVKDIPKDIDIAVRADALGYSYYEVRPTRGQYRVYVAPSYCDALYSPLQTKEYSNMTQLADQVYTFLTMQDGVCFQGI